jgi:hypothetical protein
MYVQVILHGKPSLTQANCNIDRRSINEIVHHHNCPSTVFLIYGNVSWSNIAFVSDKQHVAALAAKTL